MLKEIMTRPKFISEEDIIRWTKNIETDQNIPKYVLKQDSIKEVCFAGLYLAEELTKLNCPEDLVFRIQYTAGKMSFGKDPWEVSIMILNKFKDNTLEFEISTEDKLN